MQPLIELTDSINWNLAYREAFSAQINQYGGIINPIQPCYFQVNSHALIVTIENQNAPLHWSLGGWVSIEAPRIDIGSTPIVNRDVQICSKRIKLGTPTLVKIPSLGIPPYGVLVSFPRWHSAILIEAWWLDDTSSADPLMEGIKELDSKLNQLL